jgi:HPt (histidine-containing phosphotransfer) domain-containing protein
VDAGAERPVDLAVALRWLGGDRRLLQELVGIFVDEGPKRLEALGAAVRAVDGQQVEQIAHSLKGSASILGAGRLRDAAQALEDAAHDGQAANRLVGQVAREVERAIAFFADPTWPERLDLEAAS